MYTRYWSFPLALLVFAAGPAVAVLEPLWQCETDAAIQALPSVGDIDLDGRLEIVFPTRYDGQLWVLNSDGIEKRRVVHEHWLPGSVALYTLSGFADRAVAYQESDGALRVWDPQNDFILTRMIAGGVSGEAPPVFADLDGDTAPEVLCIRRDGVLTVMDRRLLPRWQYDAGAPVHAPPAVADLLVTGALVYVQSEDGAVHCIRGDGTPLWRRTFGQAAESHDAALLVTQAGESAVVLAADDAGRAYAANALTGGESWRAAIADEHPGAPAVADVRPEAGYEAVYVSPAGAMTVLGMDGGVLTRATLPRGRYVPRPLVADVDGDGDMEVLVASDDWALLVVDLNGKALRRLALRGTARRGAVLHDINGDGLLELLCATDCGVAYCYSTRARTGWTHSHGGAAFESKATRLRPVQAAPGQPSVSRALRPESAIATTPPEDNPFGTAVVVLGRVGRARTVSLVIRKAGAVVGAAVKPISTDGITVPFVRLSPGALTLDMTLFDSAGEAVSRASDVAVRMDPSVPVALTPPDGYIEAVGARGAQYVTPREWRPPELSGRDIWHVVQHMPARWQAFGMAQLPMVAEAAVLAPSAVAHTDMRALCETAKPFFVMDGATSPDTPFPKNLFESLVRQSDGRFLGFPVFGWAQRAWDTGLRTTDPPPATRAQATAILQSEFATLMTAYNGALFEGQSQSLFHHLAFAWGASGGFAEIGGNVLCAPLRFAFLRGASRQYGGRPWGAAISNWFVNSVADARLRLGEPPVRWSMPGVAMGEHCGHSAELELRLAVAAYLAGATFVQHEQNAFNGSIFAAEQFGDRYELSPHGAVMAQWYDYVRNNRSRGIPYTPVAFMVDSEHGWRPGERVYGIWKQGRAEAGMEAAFAHAFASDGPDFERGYLANGPYGDVFDVVSNEADRGILGRYGVVWPLGTMDVPESLGASIVDFVEKGGILVVDSALAKEASEWFLGVRFENRLAFATRIQTALGETGFIPAPYRYRPFRTSESAYVLATTGDGDPLVTWRRYGKGIVVVSGTDHWVDERGSLLPIVPLLMTTIANGFLPVQPSSGVQMLLNRTDNGWMIGLLNNRGVSKTPTSATRVNLDATTECVLRMKSGLPVQYVARLGEFSWSPQANGLKTNLPPGGVAVVEVRTDR